MNRPIYSERVRKMPSLRSDTMIPSVDDTTFLDGFLIFSYAIALWVLYKHAQFYKLAKDGLIA